MKYAATRKLVLTALVTLASIWPCRSEEPADAGGAWTLFRKGRYDEAAEQFESGKTGDPIRVVGLAQCKLAVGKREEAERILTAADGSQWVVLRAGGPGKEGARVLRADLQDAPGFPAGKTNDNA